MSSFTVNINTVEITKQIQETVDKRIEDEKNTLINKTMRELFEAPGFFNKKGGVMHQLLREQVEAISLEAVASIDSDKIRKDFDAVFTQYYNEHLPKAIERVARREAHRAAESAAKAKKVKQ